MAVISIPNLATSRSERQLGQVHEELQQRKMLIFRLMQPFQRLAPEDRWLSVAELAPLNGWNNGHFEVLCNPFDFWELGFYNLAMFLIWQLELMEEPGRSEG